MTDTPAPRLLRIATRASRLALWQAEHVANLLSSTRPDCGVELVHVTTTGDSNQVSELRSFGGQGVFTREVQRAVLDGRADLAVHSLKDLPTQPTPGLALAGVPARAETADALVLPRDSEGIADLFGLPPNAHLGTGSLRRQAQLRHHRPDLRCSEVRGNVETRLRKLDEGEYDALVLAAAGLGRLDLSQRISARLVPPLMYPAVGQGALGIECRDDDALVIDLLTRVSEPEVMASVKAERALLAQLRAGCHAPVGAHTWFDQGELRISGVVLSADGVHRLQATLGGPPSAAEDVGRELAEELLRLGAAELIR
ncbi:MAG: hydroxymethylbilane synthase [Planctomycetaceae bacterium]